MTASAPTLQKVVDQLVVEGHLAPDERPKIAETLTAAPSKVSTPWYVRGLIGISAWLAAIPLLVFLYCIDLITTEADMIFAGLAFCAVSIVLKRVVARSIFVGQLTLVFSLVGQVLFIIGVDAENSITTTVLLVILLESALIWLYPDQVHRFLSTFVIVGAIGVLLFDLEIQEAVHLVILPLAVIAVVLWENESWLSTKGAIDICAPVGYGLCVAMFGLLCLSLIDELDIFWWWISASGLLLLLLYLEYRILSHYDLDVQPGTVLWILGGTIVSAIPSIQTPGILAAIIVLVLGFRRGNRLLMGTAAAFLAFFLTAYYYSLEMTLLVKSFVLMGTGLAILAARYLFLRYARR